MLSAAVLVVIAGMWYVVVPPKMYLHLQALVHKKIRKKLNFVVIKKKLKPPSTKKKLLINKADTSGKRQSKENGKSFAKSKVTKTIKRKKIDVLNHTIEDESTSESTPKAKGNCVILL